MKTIAVHNGNFQADDVFAVSILRLLYPEIKIIRSRDPNILKTADIRADVGGKYDPLTNDFDHHQKGGAGQRENGIPYSSAGLVWKHYGRKLVSSDEVFDYIDKNIIQWIDAEDNGLDTFEVKHLEPFTIADLIRDLNPYWPNRNDKLYDLNFEKAVQIITQLLKQKIGRAEGVVKAGRIVRKKIKECKKEYLMLDDSIPWKEIVVTESNLQYVVLPDSLGDTWMVYSVPVSLTSFSNRKDLPIAWAGLTNESLQKVTGVKDATFCHNNLFVAIAKSKEGAIKLVELALQNKNG